MKYEEYSRSFTAANGSVYDATYLSPAPRVSGFVEHQWLWFEPRQEYVLAGRKPRRRGEPRETASGLEEILRLQPGEVLAFNKDGQPIAVPIPKAVGKAV